MKNSAKQSIFMAGMIVAVMMGMNACGIDMPKSTPTSYETMTVQKSDIVLPMKFSAKMKGAAQAKESSARMEYESSRNLYEKNIVSRYMLDNAENNLKQAQAAGPAHLLPCISHLAVQVNNDKIKRVLLAHLDIF